MRIELTDPTRGTSEPGRCWTQTNINEATPEVLSPLCWTFWLAGTDMAAKQAWFDFGLIPQRDLVPPSGPDQQMVNCFFGRQAINVDLIREVVALAPGASPDGFERDIFGYVRPDAPPVRQSRRRYPVVAVRMPRTIAVQGRVLRRLRDDQSAWWRDQILPGHVAEPRAVLAEAQTRFGRAMRIHLWSRSNLLSTAQTQLTALATGVGGTDLVMRLLGGFGTATETEIADRVWQMSRGRLDRAEFLGHHGYHGPSEGNPISRSWREDPAPLDALVKAYADRPDDDAPSVRQSGAAQRHQEAVRELLAGLSRSRRPVARILLRAMGTQLNRLSMGKASFLMAIDGARAAVRALGADMVARGIAAEVDDAFYLTYTELLGPEPDNFAEVVAYRRARREEYRRLRLPVVWTGTPTPIDDSCTDETAHEPTDVVTGTPGSPGVAEAEVRVVDDPADADMLEPGEVLVCRFTDPSWAVLFGLAEAVVIDIGGVASHGAVVSREMGLPCVIGTGDGTRRLRTGDLVRVDGTAGTVTIVARTPTSGAETS